MCGIAGIVAPEATAELGRIGLRLTRALAHRGPDDEGFWTLDANGGGFCSSAELDDATSIVVGTRRLSIVDLAGGRQPMANEDETVWVSFNGEIYNHVQLREELVRHGHRFRTDADTEVLVHGWEEWREGLFGRLNGIFAAALVDVRRRDVVLVRDPVGVKPLYIGVDRGRTWWASELAAAQRAGAASTAISRDGLKLFLLFRFVPSPHTILEDAWKIPPSHYVRVPFGDPGTTPVFHPYECAVKAAAAPRTRDEWSQALLDELDCAVERQLMADVPVASMLSGGVDSSLITTLMTEHLPYSPLTFGIGLRGDGIKSEAVAAEQAAHELGVPHRSTLVGDEDYVRGWPDALAHLGEPIANPSALMVQLICEQVSQHRKVILTGQGADEPLGGYSRHLVERFLGLGRHAPRLSYLLVRAARGADDAERLRRALAGVDRIDRYVGLFSVFAPQEVDELVPGSAGSALDLARAAVARWAATDPPDDVLNELLYVDARMSLADDLLAIADHFSMRWSVELRVPFLDLAFLDLVERMPSRYKISRLGARKWVYRQAAARRLPPELARRLCGFRGALRTKRGFSTPLTSWFEAREGVLSDPALWSGGLSSMPGLSALAIEQTTEPTTHTDQARRRATLFALAMWRAQGDVGRTAIQAGGLDGLSERRTSCA